MTSEMEKAILDKLVFGLIEKAVERLEAIRPWEEENYIKPATMRRTDAAHYMGISPTLLDKLNIPKIHPNGVGRGKTVLYRRETIDDWLRKRELEENKTIDEFIGDEFSDDEMKVS